MSERKDHLPDMLRNGVRIHLPPGTVIEARSPTGSRLTMVVPSGPDAPPVFIASLSEPAKVEAPTP